MNEKEKLRVLLPHWIEHNGEHAKEFRQWADRAGPAKEHILTAAELVEEANDHLAEALKEVGGLSEHGPMGEEHGHHHHE